MRPFLLSLLALLMLFSSGSSRSLPPGSGGPNSKKWQQVDQLLKKDQTASAAKLVEELYRAARQRQDTPEYLRALLYKLRLLEAKEENADVKSIALVEADVKTAQFPARPILHSLLAQLYAQYYDAHRYQLYNRTATAPNAADASAADIQTWDAARLGSAVVQHYRASLHDEPRRQQKLQLAALGYAVRGGTTESRQLRPTLYDLLAHRAIEGLGNDEFYITTPAAQFELQDPALFGPAADFARLPLTAPAADSLNGQFHALQALQQLTAFRLTEAANPAALADVTLKRLRFVHQHAQMADKDALYRAALAREAEVYQSLPISTEFMAEQALSLEETEPAKAHELALLAENRFPKSVGGRRAASLRQRLEAVELDFTTEEVVLPGQPWLLKLDVRNAPQLYAKAYRVSTAQAVRTRFDDTDGEALDFRKTYARALAAKPAAAWPLDLAGPTDYRRHSVQHAGPALPVGHYVIVISTTAENATKEQAGISTAYAELTASSLSQVRRSSAQEGPEVLVLDRQNGQPRSGVTVLPFFQYYDQKARQYKRRRGPAQTTTADGLSQVRLGPATGDNLLLQAVLLTQGTDSLLTGEDGGYSPRYNRQQLGETVQRQVFLYTDRAIYRPGQTLYFKGIATETRAGKSVLLTKLPVTVHLRDVNGQAVQTLSFVSSDFGSFHGSLVLPTGLLNGEMSLQTDLGNASFAVEDYKRPTFQVTFEPVPGTPVLGQTVTVRGKATAYAGQPIDGATVQYRVVRRTLWPLFGRGFGGPRGPGQVEILSGTTQTDSAGGFTVQFVAKGEALPAGKRGPWQPGYGFEITADVTDAAGETRTGEQSVSIGADALSLRLEMPELINREKLPLLRLLSTNAAGTPQPTRGQLRLYRLTPPAAGWRPRPWPRPEREALSREEFKRQFSLDAYGREDNDSTWARTLVLSQEFDTEKSPLLTTLPAALAQQAPGRYLLEATASPGKEPVKAEHYFTLYSATVATLPLPAPNWFVALQDSVAPGQPARFLVGSSEAGARILLEAEAQGETLRREWLTLAANEQRVIEIPVALALDGEQLYVHITQVRDNRLYLHTAQVQVATPPAPLVLSVATFRDKLQPGQKETWRVTIHQADGKPAAAELLATLYDKSLDVFRPHSLLPLAFPGTYHPASLAWNGRFGTEESTTLFGGSPGYGSGFWRLYPGINWWGYLAETENGVNEEIPDQEELEDKVVATQTVKGNTDAPDRFGSARRAAPMAAKAEVMRMADSQAMAGNSAPAPASPPAAGAAPQPDLSAVQARKDFRETAFWLPDLRTNAQGETVLEFQMPEAVTRWQLLALAHDQQLHSGLLQRELVTQKQLQVTPNAPRFFREGDQLRFSAKLSNLTDQPLSGTAQLFLFDARTQQPVEARVLKSAPQLPFSLPANQSASVSWELTIPETAEGQLPLEALTYRVVAQGQATATAIGKKPKRTKNQKPTTNTQQPVFSDGEENTLPVLPNRILITESLPLPIVGPATREFELKKLTSTTSATRRNYSLTLEMTQNPAWYAVQALPYLTEYPYECSEQVFSRLYANLLAAKILQSNPRIRPVLDEWKRAAQSGDKAALTSKLEQNQELKSLLLQETPWVRDAQSETERMRRLTELFDETRLKTETSRALTKLAKMQSPNGAFPWFERMPDDRYITQLIVAGFGKLQRLGAFSATQDAQAGPILSRALSYLDKQLQHDYAELRRQKGVDLKQNHLHDLQIQALYARSFWPAPALARADQPAYAYYQQQAAAFWPDQTRYLQAQIALALHRQKAQPAAVKDILTALAQNALHSDELGMYWKEVRGGYYWREAPTETQATLIEAFDEVQNDQRAVDEMKLWLLKQKQTQNWPSTRATADACYALLLRGSDWLQPVQPLQITLGGVAAPAPKTQQAGTGYFNTTFDAASIRPEQGKVTVRKTDAGVAWGALYWQYFEQIDQVTAATAGLQLERQFYREQRTAGGPVLEPLTAASPLRVGDVLVVRLVLRADRDLEYVHLKDQRAAGLELVAQTSGYRYQGGLGYYESPRDAATNFFISYFPKGTHTFEYRLRAAQSGNFSGGLSQLQCLYAPEFAAHSAGTRVRVEPLGDK
ncbi:alpha-2-macroglobulin family protein [Hymenobacter chitinivorans]|uniref:MG2 domain-containing protein n=1 Tax=Hymenobacter chitinivorans DSM 11115 TaxID=1121954 RepID=A0A2M9BAA1_9BACT|nr:alpha-2-macroglobulin family protein [Hymenobacter chitinivorans]PJJ54871.1 MG2 domain-containing protein [Hymenobacter chitinivorans DSM 11115]